MTLRTLPCLTWRAARDGRWIAAGEEWSALGMAASDLMDRGWCALLAGEGAEATISAHDRAAAAGEGGRVDAEIALGGVRRWLRLVLAPASDASDWVAGHAVEVTDLVAAVGIADHRVARLQHRIKNNLQVVISLLGLQAHFLKTPGLRGQLEDAVQRVRCVALMQDQVYQAADVTRIPVASALGALCEQLGLGGGIVAAPAANGVPAPADAVLPGDRASALILLCNEVLMSLLKPPGGDGEREGEADGRLDLVRQDAETLRVVVRVGEAGRSLDPLAERLAGLLARQLRAEIRNEAGVLILVVPLGAQ